MPPRRLISAVATLGVAGLVLLSAPAALAAPAQVGAVETTIPLKSAHTNQLATSTAFGRGCDQIPGGVPIRGKDGWVFVLPGDVGGRFVQLLITFRKPGGQQVQIKIEDATSPYANGIVKGQGDNKAFVVVPAGWTLVKGEAQVAGAKEGKGKTPDFNVTHTCVGGDSGGGDSGGGNNDSGGSGGDNGNGGKGDNGGGGNDNGGGGDNDTGGGGDNGGGDSGGSPSAPPAAAPPVATPGEGGGSGLPVTGTDLGVLLGTALAMIGTGVTLIVLHRRRGGVTFSA